MSGRGWTPEDERPLPELPFFRKVLEDLWEGYFTLVMWSLLMWVLSIPLALFGTLGLVIIAFTVAPTLTGLLVASGKAARGGFARLGDAARGTLRLYWRSVALALPLLCLLALANFTAGVIRDFPERQEMFFAWAGQIGLGLALAVLHIYLLPVLALYETSLKRTVQVALALAGRFVWQTLALMATAVVLLALTMLHPLVWIVVVGIWCVVIMNAVWRMTREHAAQIEREP